MSNSFYHKDLTEVQWNSIYHKDGFDFLQGAPEM